MLDQWQNDLLAQYLPYEYEKGKHGEIQLGLREIKLFEIAFPETHYDAVLSAVWPYDRRAGALARILRKILRLGKVKEVKQAHKIAHRHPWVSVIGIGVKKDKYDKDGIESL